LTFPFLRPVGSKRHPSGCRARAVELNLPAKREAADSELRSTEPMEQREPCELAQTWPSRDRGGQSQHLRSLGKPKGKENNESY